MTKKIRQRRSPNRSEHQIFTHVFTNEFGKRIELTVQDAILEGKPAVAVWLKGPNSFSESCVTRREAKALADLLSFMLNQGRPT